MNIKGGDLLVGLIILLVGYILGLMTEWIKVQIKPKPKLVFLSYGEGLVGDSQTEGNTLIIGNIGKVPCEKVRVSFDFFYGVDSSSLKIYSECEYEKVGFENNVRPQHIYFPIILPNQIITMQYKERYILMESVQIAGLFPIENILVPSNTSVINLADKPKMAGKLIAMVKSRERLSGFYIPENVVFRPNAHSKESPTIRGANKK